MTFTERMSSMLNPDVLSAAIKEQQSAEDTGSYGRLKRDQNIWNPDGKISSDQNSHTLGEKTFQRAYSDIKVAKGNATEEAVCYSLKDQFSSIETQRKIDLEKNTYTKSDIIATHANQNIQIGDISIKEGESMGVEVKCGEAAYLSSQISHIDKQLSGFDVYERQDESVKFHKVVVVTADYYQMSDSSKGHLNDVVKSHNACIHVLPFFANDITQTMARME